MPVNSLILYTVSILLFCSSVVFLGRIILRPYFIRSKTDFCEIKNSTKRVFYAILHILGAMWTLDMSVGIVGKTGITSVFDQFVGSFLHALMTFAMDGYVNDLIADCHNMIEKSFEVNTVVSNIFYVYPSIICLVAPIAGGAFIFDIIAELSPQFHFFVAKLFFWREKYYFTALNEQSLSLAKDIVSSNPRRRGTIVFTDAYSDDNNEESSERMLRARALGAICLKDDLMHISINRSRIKTVRIYLSDSKENDNLEELSKILLWKNRKLFNNLEIYVFSSDENNDNNISFFEDEVIYINNRIMSELEIADKEKKDVFEKKMALKNADKQQVQLKESKLFPMPRVIPVNSARNMAQNLFFQIPLFEGMYGKRKDEKALKLTIMGSGVIGTEIFLNAYWMGQMLDTELDVTVVSKGPEETFYNKINYLNTEILRTCNKDDSILDYFNTAGKSERRPYLNLHYIENDVTSSAFMQNFTKKTDDNQLIDSDYFVIALGSDDDDFTVADKLRQAVGCYHLNDENARNRKTIISYVIYNSELCRNLNRKCRHSNVVNTDNQTEFDVYMHAFGSMDEVYSMKNIMFDGIKSEKKTQSLLDNLKKWRGISANYYNYRADIARKLHIYYKVFSAGMLNPTLFSSVSDTEYRKGLADGLEKYRRYVESEEKKDFQLLHNLSWLEHRRWNAFLRICGFTYPEDFERYYHLNNDIHKNNDHKFLMLKLHPCLVESDMNGIRAELDKYGKIIGDSAIKTDGELDLLDEITLKKITLNKEQPIAENDFKKWDYPEFERF